MSAPRPPRPLPRLAWLAGAALLVIPASADAQFGKLAKRAAAAAVGAAAGDAAAERIAGTGSGPADASTLEITGERLDAFVAGMRGPMEAARVASARRAERRDLEARAAAYDACRKKAEVDLGAALYDTTPEGLERAAVLGNRMSAMVQRSFDAQQAGNAALATALGDSITALGDTLEEVQMPGLARACGKKLVVPHASHTDAVAEDAALRPAVPADMTPVQFGVLRERVAAWLVANGVGAALTPAESAALESRREALAPLAPFFRERSLEWVNVLAGVESGR